MQTKINFDQFLKSKESILKTETGLKEIYEKIEEASKKISFVVNHAALEDIIGKAGTENVQGEEVQRLDIISNDWLIESLKSSKYCAGVASEEMEDFIAFEQSHNDEAQYIVLFDPLDGSSNIDTCSAIGTIFSIYKRKSKGELLLSDFLQKGNDILSAGYVIYGSSTIFVYSMGNGVNAFTLDQKEQVYILSHENIRTPSYTNILSISFGYYNLYNKPDTNFIDWCLEEDKDSKRPFTHRYIGSMVADIHRNLLKGGIFLYPTTSKSPKGKLRLQYECNPLSFIQKQAGGKYTDGVSDILEIVPTELHQRVPIALGSSELVERYLSFK
jgi:fructose-1,6-bisphosphatase I